MNLLFTGTCSPSTCSQPHHRHLLTAAAPESPSRLEQTRVNPKGLDESACLRVPWRRRVLTSIRPPAKSHGAPVDCFSRYIPKPRKMEIFSKSGGGFAEK